MLRDVQNQYGSNLSPPFFFDFEKPHGFLAYALLSRNDKLLLGEKSPSTYLGIIKRGTDTIGFGRNYLWSSCLK